MTNTAFTAPLACCSVSSGGRIALMADLLTHTGDLFGRVSFNSGGFTPSRAGQRRCVLGSDQHPTVDAVHICMRADIVRIGAGDEGDGIFVDDDLGPIERANGDHACVSSSLGIESRRAPRLSQAGSRPG